MRRSIGLVLALTAAMALAAPAQASFHLMLVREIHAGSGGDYVELQMYSSGQNFVAGHTITTYDAAGAVESTFTFPDSVDNGGSQRTILVGTGPGIGATPDFTTPIDVSADAGTVCFETIDCASYGGATPPAGPPSPVGVSAPSLPDAQSLERSIAPGCATFLEASDDTNDSASDFAVAAPSPRPNSVAPTETTCTGGGGGAGGDNNPPQTTITKGPKKKSEKTKAKFKFESSESNSSFQCALDKGDFKKCTSPKKYKNLDPGKHKFFVRAIDKAGNVDPTPGKYKFKVID